MKFNPDKHHRRSVRLKDYDYSQVGSYFITVCTFNRECILGKIFDNKMELNEFGKIVQTEWIKSSKIRTEIELDVFQIMPNHFHGIVCILSNDVRTRPDNLGSLQQNNRPKMKSKSLSSLMTGFQSSVTSKINKLKDTPNQKVWQRSYYDRIIRNEKELNAIRNYIINNPIYWEKDSDNPQNLGVKS